MISVIKVPARVMKMAVPTSTTTKKPTTTMAPKYHNQHQNQNQLPFLHFSIAAAAAAAAALGLRAPQRRRTPLRRRSRRRRCCCYRSMVELKWYTRCHAVELYKQGGPSTRSSTSPFGTTHPPQQAGESVAYQRAAGGPLAQSNASSPRILQLHLSSLCAPSGCRVVYSKQHGAWRHGRCSVFISQWYGEQKCTVHFVKFLPSLEYFSALFKNLSQLPN